MDLKGASVISVDFARHIKPFYFTKKNHRQKHYLIRLQITGSSQIDLNGIQYDIFPGDLVFVKPGDVYKLMIKENLRTQRRIESTDYYLFCQGEWIRNWWKSQSPPPKANIPLDENILGTWRRLIYEKRNIHEQNDDLLDYLTRVLFISISRAIRNGSERSTNESFIPYQIKNIIEKQATEQITLENIADELGISISTASHLFKKTFNQSIIRYLVEVRLSIASERMLVSRLKLEDIALASGFQSYPYFSRAFSARFGMSPSKYRKMNQRY